MRRRTGTFTSYGPRELMLGVEHLGSARAYRVEQALQQKLIQDRIGGTPVIVAVGPDSKSVRVFEARIPGREEQPECYRNADGIFIDSLTGSNWNFRGCALTGPATGQSLLPIPALKNYWFDWHLYNPKTTAYSIDIFAT